LNSHFEPHATECHFESHASYYHFEPNLDVYYGEGRWNDGVTLGNYMLQVLRETNTKINNQQTKLCNISIFESILLPRRSEVEWYAVPFVK
jgi:hypothetical protein